MYKFFFNAITALFVIFFAFSIFMRMIFWLNQMPMFVWVIGSVAIYVMLCEGVYFFYNRMKLLDKKEEEQL